MNAVVQHTPSSEKLFRMSPSVWDPKLRYPASPSVRHIDAATTREPLETVVQFDRVGSFMLRYTMKELC